MVGHFRAFLREHYGGDEAALREAWRDPAATFATAAIPLPVERLNWGHRGVYHYVETRGLAGARFPGGTGAAAAAGELGGPDAGCTFGSDLDPEWFRAKQEWGGFLYDREKYKFTPAFSVDDPGARVMGLLRGLDAPGLAVKEMDGWRSVFIAAPLPPWRLLANLLRFAGGHLYSESNDLIYANAEYVACQANGDGPKTLRLPRPSAIFDAMTGDRLAAAADHYTFAARHGQVEIFRIGPAG